MSFGQQQIACRLGGGQQLLRYDAFFFFFSKLSMIKQSFTTTKNSQVYLNLTHPPQNTHITLRNHGGKKGGVSARMISLVPQKSMTHGTEIEREIIGFSIPHDTPLT